jgi:hypothetical protein
MRRVIRAIAIRKNTHLCERCKWPARRTDDKVRVFRLGINIHMHWSCFILQLHEHDQHDAQVVAEALR